MQGAPFACILDEDLGTLEYDFDLVSMRGEVRLRECVVRVESVRAIYLRPGTPRGTRAAEAAASLLALSARIAGTVVNRPAAGASNLSKPYQLRRIAAAGIDVPETLVTTDSRQARAFLARHGKLVYKSISGVRSIVSTLDAASTERLGAIAHGPVQLQRWIEGRDVRVHVVGARWFATAIECAADDYRYAARDGATLTMSSCDIPADLARRLIALTRSLGLLVSGIDLRVTSDGRWYCFEANPSPGFTFYEEHTGQPIAAAIAGLLVRASSKPHKRSHAMQARRNREASDATVF